MTNKIDETYLGLLKDVLENGKRRSNRTRIDTLGVFGRQVRYPLKEGFPILTTKKVSFHNVKVELLWFLSGRTDVKYLQDHKVKIWDEWANKDGELVSCYGKQWRKWVDHTTVGVYRCWKNETEYEDKIGMKTIDQIANVIKQIKTNPNSRRLIVNAWNPAEVEQASLPWCHQSFQFYVQDGELSCHLLQRSGDIFLGIPYNISSYCLLTYMIAQVCDLQVGEFVHSITDLHLYINHVDQANLQLSRDPLPLPKLWLNPEVKNIDDFKYDDIKIIDYQSHPTIKGDVAI